MTERTYTLTLTAQEVDLIGKVLGEMPFKTVASLVAKLNDQLREQASPPASPTGQPA